MLSLYYDGLDAGIRRPVGEFSRLTLVGKSLLAENGVYIAFLNNGLWRTPRRNFAALGIASNVGLWFDDQADCSERLGPFEYIRLVSGSVWADDRLLAGYDARQDEWHRPGDEHPWPVILIRQPSQVYAPVFQWDACAVPQLT